MDLFSPLGEKYTTQDKSEITRLKTVHGYTEKKPTPTEVKVNTGEKAPAPIPNPDTVKP